MTAKAYWIARVTVTDPVAYSGYQALAPEAFAKYDARFLARGGETVTCEGHAVPRFLSSKACKRTGPVHNKKGHQMSAFDENLFLKGLEQRKATLGAEYVESNLAQADDLTKPFQEAMTAWCWGFGWGDDTIDAKTRSMMNLAMIGALGKMQEWELHCRGAIRNGVSQDEIRAIIHVIAIYCGVPQGLECFRAARKVLENVEE